MADAPKTTPMDADGESPLEVSVVVVCFNEADNILPCLASLAAQTYPAGHFEIVVADGGSADGTGELVAEFAQRTARPPIRLVVEPTPGTAAGRNAGVRACRNPLVAFIDADCEAPPDWLTRLMAHYRRLRGADQRVVAVGGPNLPPPGSPPFVEAIGIALDTYAGGFNSAQGRRFPEIREVESLANLNVVYDRGRLEEVGLYDESLRSDAEDADINFRLRRAGYRFLFVPDTFVWHKMRPTPRIWFRNMTRYGRGRARLLKRHPAMWRPAYVLPLLFLCLLALTPLGLIWPILATGLAYFPAIALYALWLAWSQRRPALAGWVMVAFLSQHFGYALGEAKALLDPRV